MTSLFAFGIFIGLVIGFLISLFTLDRMYREAFRRWTESIHANYQRELDKLKKYYEDKK